MIKYVFGDATRPGGDGRKIITHVCNDAGGWGAGFVIALSDRWPETRREYQLWHEGYTELYGKFELGAVQFVPVDNGTIYIANMIAQHGFGESGTPPIRYDAVETCLTRVAENARRIDATIHMPRIGCGLAGGTWEKVEPIIERTLIGAGLPVTVYDLPVW